MSEEYADARFDRSCVPIVAKIVIGLHDLESRTRSSILGGPGTGGVGQMTRKGRPFAIWVIFSGLVFAGLDLLYGISPDLINRSAFDIFFVPLVVGFVLFCFIAGVASFMQKRWGYVLSIVVSLGFVLSSLAVIIPTVSNPFDFTTFAVAISSVPVLVLVAIFSILCLVNVKRGLLGKRYLSSPRSAGGVLTVAVILLVMGGVISGASQVLARGSDARSPSAVSIVLGANNPQNTAGHFGPDTITVVIGINNTITWTNHDFSLHTVTSDGGSFDSGLLNSGDSWSHTFTSPGTYGYHCTIHPYMTGTVVVKGG